MFTRVSRHTFSPSPLWPFFVRLVLFLPFLCVSFSLLSVWFPSFVCPFHFQLPFATDDLWPNRHTHTPHSHISRLTCAFFFCFPHFAFFFAAAAVALGGVAWMVMARPPLHTFLASSPSPSSQFFIIMIFYVCLYPFILLLLRNSLDLSAAAVVLPLLVLCSATTYKYRKTQRKAESEFVVVALLSSRHVVLVIDFRRFYFLLCTVFVLQGGVVSGLPHRALLFNN